MVEVRRLHTSIRDEQVLFQRTLTRLGGAPIHTVIEDFIIRRSNVNQMLLDQIHAIYSLPGYNGSKVCGTCLGEAPLAVPDPVLQQADDADDNKKDNDVVEEVEEDVNIEGEIF